jgi:hypothetical protein
MTVMEKIGAMQKVWLKKCARCGNDIKKTDPEESVMCCATGWQEHDSPFFCEFIRNYCDREEKI